MAESGSVMQQLPIVLDGKFFSVATKTSDGKVVAKCMNCVNKSISGTVQSTSNFIRHLKVCITARLEIVVTCHASTNTTTSSTTKLIVN